MATKKETLERLVNKEEILYWARKNAVEIEIEDDRIHVDDWSIILDDEDKIAAVERRLDVPREL
ncbi:hypothetical protein SEA_COMRADE_4 [Streptomyces phage Comrade]|uniref:Uncharacterized protein n=2 Tax=Gilsonvirus comrade TaxID=2846395 RepID=A0A345MDU1_9CAUD|nr:hypothetical protein HWB84_gp004 [Streptomyces phage Comrade]AXH68722.1 hypothetical protein SEA_SPARKLEGODDESS_4 [Streptomyces phage SparkleGoddess]AXQ63282.1 hypothetical protein SEA_COMRADE_4 [Streptomyces phage Comrade]